MGIQEAGNSTSAEPHLVTCVAEVSPVPGPARPRNQQNKIMTRKKLHSKVSTSAPMTIFSEEREQKKIHQQRKEKWVTSHKHKLPFVLNLNMLSTKRVIFSSTLESKSELMIVTIVGLSQNHNSICQLNSMLGTTLYRSCLACVGYIRTKGTNTLAQHQLDHTVRLWKWVVSA